MISSMSRPEAPRSADAAVGVAHRAEGGDLAGEGVDQDVEAVLGQHRPVEAVGLAHQRERAAEHASGFGDLVGVAGEEHEHVGAGLAVGGAALEGALEGLVPHRAGAGDDDEVVVAAGIDGLAHLVDHHLERDEVLDALVVMGPLGRDLVLDLDRGRAGRLDLADGARGVQGITEADAAVDNQWYI